MVSCCRTARHSPRRWPGAGQRCDRRPGRRCRSRRCQPVRTRPDPGAGPRCAEQRELRIRYGREPVLARAGPAAGRSASAVRHGQCAGGPTARAVRAARWLAVISMVRVASHVRVPDAAASVARSDQRPGGSRSTCGADQILYCLGAEPQGRQFPAAPAQVLRGQGAGEFSQRDQQVPGQHAWRCRPGCGWRPRRRGRGRGVRAARRRPAGCTGVGEPRRRARPGLWRCGWRATAMAGQPSWGGSRGDAAPDAAVQGEGVAGDLLIDPASAGGAAQPGRGRGERAQSRRLPCAKWSSTNNSTSALTPA